MNDNSSLHTARVVHKVGSSNTAAAVLVLFGLLFFLFVHWVLGLVILVVGLALAGTSKKVSTCGECGNEVANTSRMCPHCHAGFDRVHTQSRGKGVLYATLGSLAVAGVIGVAMWWMINQANR